MNDQTAHLVSALGAVNQRIPEVCRTLLANEMMTAKQREFAGLLIELGNVLHSHANDQEMHDSGDTSYRGEFSGKWRERTGSPRPAT